MEIHGRWYSLAATVTMVLHAFAPGRNAFPEMTQPPHPRISALLPRPFWVIGFVALADMYFLTSYRNRLSTGGERWRERGGSVFCFLVCIVSYPKLTAKVNQNSSCLLSGHVHHLWSAWEDTGVNGNIHRYYLQLTAYVGLCPASYWFL